MPTSLETYQAFEKAGALSYLVENGEDISEQQFQEVLKYKPESARVQIQSVFRVRDIDRNEFLTWQFLIFAEDYFDTEHPKDDKSGTYSKPDAYMTKDQFGHPQSVRIKQIKNEHVLPWSVENFENLLTNFTYWHIDKQDLDERGQVTDDYFKKKRHEMHPQVIRQHLTKYYIGIASTAPDRVAERPMYYVENIDDFKYLPWDKLWEFARDTRVSKSGELRRFAHPDTLKILKSLNKEQTKII